MAPYKAGVSIHVSTFMKKGTVWLVKKNVINIFESQYSCCEVVELQINCSLFAPFEGVRTEEVSSALLCEDLFSSGVF